MPYTHSWDETQPPDTQAANLLGQDIRDLKTDVRERITSFGAGTLANRPTPESVWVGALYFATDTGRLYRWGGSSWTDVTSSFFLNQIVLTDTAVVTISSFGDANSVTIQANTLWVGALVDVYARCASTAITGTPRAQLYFGATKVSDSVVQSNQDVVLEAHLLVTGSNSQRNIGSSIAGSAASSFGYNASSDPAEAIAGPIVVKSSVPTSAPVLTGSIRFDLLIVRITR